MDYGINPKKKGVNKACGPLLRTPPTRHLLLQPARPRPAPPRPHHPRGHHVALRHPSPRALRPHDCGTPQLHVLLQTLNTCTPCLAATPRHAPAPKTAHEIPSPCAERRPRLWPAPGTPHNARAKLQCPACCTCYRVQALVQPRTVLARTAAQPTNELHSLASPSQTEGSPSVEAFKA